MNKPYIFLLCFVCMLMMFILSIITTHNSIIAAISRNFLDILKWCLLIFGGTLLGVCVFSMIIVLTAAIIDELSNFKK